MWNLSPSFAIYFLCGLRQVTYLFWTSVSWICFSSLKGGERRKGAEMGKKGREPQDGLKVRTTACERPVQIPDGNGGGQKPLWELMKYLVFLCFQPFFVQIGPLLPIMSAISIKALCEWEVFVEIEEGADFHIGVYVVLNRNIWGSRILQPRVTVSL